MKRKTFYLLVLVCFLSVFSSAKQTGYSCKKIGWIMEGSASQQPVKPEQKSGMGFDLSPLQLFVFNL